MKTKILDSSSSKKLNNSNKHYSFLSRLLIIIIIIIIPIILFSGYLLNSKLYLEAYRNTNYLNKITILNGQKLHASAKPDGDFTTGSDALAIAELKVDDSLENLYKESMDNLKAQGYSGDGYTNKSSSNHDVYFKTTNGEKSIVLEFKFKEPIICDETNTNKVFCNNTRYVTLETSGLKDIKINKIRVVYDND